MFPIARVTTVVKDYSADFVYHALILLACLSSCFSQSSTGQTDPEQNPGLFDQLRPGQSNASSQDQQTNEELLRQLQQQQEQQPIRITNTHNRIEEPRPEAPKPATSPLQARTAAENNEFQNFVAQSVGQKLP